MGSARRCFESVEALQGRHPQVLRDLLALPEFAAVHKFRSERPEGDPGGGATVDRRGVAAYPITTNASTLMTQADFAAAQIGAISNRQSGVTLSGTFNATSLAIGGTNIPGWTLNQVIACAESNPLTTNTFSARWYPPKNCWLIDALPSVIYPATGTNLQVSLERENTRLATLSIPSGQYVGSLVSLTNAPLSDTNYISVRILRIGTGEGGGGLSVRIRYGMAP